jgi:hypothetical protein
MLYHGQNRNQVMCLISASEERLRIEADRCAWDLELDSHLTREYGNGTTVALIYRIIHSIECEW